MRKLLIAVTVGLFCFAVTLYPARAAQSGTAGIEFYEPSESRPPGGGSSSNRTGGSSVADGNPISQSNVTVEPPDDDLVWIVDPQTPMEDLVPLPATGSQSLLATILILAGVCLMVFSVHPKHPTERSPWSFPFHGYHNRKCAIAKGDQ